MTFDQAAAWHQFRFDGSNARAAERVLRDFWGKAKRVAARLPFAEDLIAAYYCALDKATPLQVKAALVGALAYFVLPIDLRPDFLPFVGFTDDAAVLFAVLRLVGGHVRPEHREAARDALARMQE
jgi:uncharacterized membrane protein YkvA (DUF1232 family)